MDQSNTVELESTGQVEVALSKKRFSFWETSFGEALKDYMDGCLLWRMWGYMAVADIKRRYRRTVIGPFWTTLSLAIFVTTMGLLFSILWHIQVKTFLPFFASGFICWMFFSSVVAEGCHTFVGNEGLVKQVSLPYSSFAYLVIARNFLVFLHQFIVFIVVALIFDVKVNMYTLLIIPGFLLLFLSSSWITIFLGLICARYRDVQQVVASLLQISMFVTPIFWPPEQLNHHFAAHLLMKVNPLYHYIAIVRQPLLGEMPTPLSWWMVSAITMIGWLVTMCVMAKQRRKLIFWLL